MVKFYKTGKLPLSSNELKEVSNYFGVQFPDEYQRFMLEYNGGTVEDTHNFKYADNIGAIAWFYDVDKNSNSDLKYNNEMRKGRFPKGFVSIGTNGGGDEICIDCGAGEGFGKVYFWDHNFEADQSDPEFATPELANNFFLIADSFDTFLRGLFKAEHTEDRGEMTVTITPKNKELLEETMRRLGLS